MLTTIDLETVPCADRDSYLHDAKDNFKAPSGLTKTQAGKDLGLEGDKLKFTSASDVIAQWEKEMASVKSEQVGDRNWRKTALDATYGRVLAIGWDAGDGPDVLIGEPENEAQTIGMFFKMMDETLCQKSAAGRPPFFIGHNVTFDLKFLFRRAVILGINPPFGLPFKGRHEKDYFCTMQAWCEYGERISLDNLCKALGIKGKGDFDGSMVCDAWQAGEFDKIKSYCADDVSLAKQVFRRLQFLEDAV